MVFPDKSMTNSELCEAVRPQLCKFIEGLPDDKWLDGDTKTDGLTARILNQDLKRLVKDYERLLAAAMDVFREHGEHIAVPQNPEWVELKAVIEATEK